MLFPLRFLSSLYECSITANQHSPCPRNTQLPCQVIAKKRFHIWLPSILLHMPSKGFCLSPIKVLIPTVSGASTPPHVMDWPTELCQSTWSTSPPSHFSWLFCVGGQWAPLPRLQPPLVNKTKIVNDMAHCIQEHNRASQDCMILFSYRMVQLFLNTVSHLKDS